VSYTTLVIGTGVVFYLATCVAIIDIARKDFGGMEKKLIWGLITLVPFVGPVIYFGFGYRKGNRSESGV
jgi:hypothetical protein